MISFVKTTLRMLGVDTTKLYHSISAKSLTAALREQGLEDICRRLREILPNILDQYSHGLDSGEYEYYWERKMRGLHAFQIRSVIESLEIIAKSNLTIADIGDSSGNHGIYIEALVDRPTIDYFVSVNLDEKAVQKIKAKGRQAIQCRAEKIHETGLKPDLALTFEMLEHLTDPLMFLRRMSEDVKAQYVLMTVPFRRQSRFGGELLRQAAVGSKVTLTAERTHLFELSKEDWQLMLQLAGYKPRFTKNYYQYPQRSFWRIAAPLWKRLDFEGFIAILAERDTKLSNEYLDWP